MPGSAGSFRTALGLVLVLALAAALRVWGISFGLPELNHADEPIVVHHALGYGLGDLNPHFFNIPPLTSYLLFLAYVIFFLAGHAQGVFPTKESFIGLYVNDPSAFYLIGRLVIGALPGVIAVWAVYRLSRLVWERSWSLAAALITAVLFLPVQLSHFIYPDSPLFCSLVVSLLFYLKVWKKGRPGDYWLAGISSGAAVALKYNAALLILAFLTAHALSLLRRKVSLKEWLGGPAAFLLSAGAVFFLLNPFFFIDFSYARSELAEQAASTGFQGFWHPIQYSLRAALGLPLLGFALAAFLASFFFLARAPYLAVFQVAAVVFYLHLALFSQPYGRYGILLVPPAVFLSVFLLREIGTRLAGGRVLAVLLLIGLLFIPIESSVLLDRLLARGDTRNLAGHWIKKHVPSGSRIFLDVPRFMPKLARCREGLEEVLSRLEPGTPQALRIKAMLQRGGSGPCYRVYTLRSEDEERRRAFALEGEKIPLEIESLRKARIQYVALARQREDYPAREVLEDVRRNGRLVVRFSPYRDAKRRTSLDAIDLTGAPTLLEDLKSRKRNGHTIEIYRMHYEEGEK